MPDLPKKTFTLDLQPVGRRAEVELGVNLLDAARALGVGLVSLCGGEGWCESCLVRLVQGKLSPLTLLEEAHLDPDAIDQGYRLACQAEILSSVKIEIPPSSLDMPQRLQIEGSELHLELNPAVKTVAVSCPPPDLVDLRADSTRLLDALAEKGFPVAQPALGLLAALSPRLRLSAWEAHLALRAPLYPDRGPLWSLVSILPPADSSSQNNRVFGLAADIGTTKLAVYLLDLESGETVEKVGTMNPQIAYGEDVISRITFTREHHSGRKTLQSALINVFNEIITAMCTRQQISPDQIVEAVFVGNTAMHHLFAGLPVEQLGLAPCVPAVSQAIELPAAALGLKMAVEAQVYLLPNIAGYVGADHVAMLLATGLWQKPGIALGVDIGTNTEISLVSQGEIWSCSAASGPAFEGAHIHNGMRAAAGAIERVKISSGELHVFSIENQPPVGICGSGILDAVAEMRLAGVINEKGALQIDHPLVHTDRFAPNGVPLLQFVLVPAEESGHGKEITLSRKDINEIQLAKSAIRTGIDVLLEYAGVSAESITEFIIAGAFGSYINVASAIQIGMFPDLPLERFSQVGNAAGIGARAALLSLDQRRLADHIALAVKYIELTSYPDFQARFLKGMYL